MCVCAVLFGVMLRNNPFHLMLLDKYSIDGVCLYIINKYEIDIIYVKFLSIWSVYVCVCVPVCEFLVYVIVVRS